MSLDVWGHVRMSLPSPIIRNVRKTITTKGWTAFLPCNEGRWKAHYLHSMNKLLNKRITSLSSLPSRQATNHSLSLGRTMFSLFTWVVVVLALAAGVILLARDVFLTGLSHAPVSAAPLLLIGTAYLGFQFHLRPKPLDLFKALIVSSAFILWGVDQLLPGGWVATTLGDVVITLYVLDLGWMMIDRLKQRAKPIDKEC
jgi:hypothetical protein